jgi:cytochrome c oxidase subunit 3
MTAEVLIKNLPKDLTHPIPLSPHHLLPPMPTPLTQQHPPRFYRDESPIPLNRHRQRLPRWLQRFLPMGGGLQTDHEGQGLFGFAIFLGSETMIFATFILTYVIFRSISEQWLPPGIKGPQLTTAVILHSIALVSSSFVIYFAERALKRGNLLGFRLFWVATSVLGAFFLVGELQEWSGLDFTLQTGLLGATFYLITGTHGLHVMAGITLQLVMLWRSFQPGNYDNGHFGVTAVSLFWHFVDVIWILLFSLFYLWKT